MPNWMIWLLVSIIFATLVLLQVAVKSKRPVRRALTGVFTGIFVLALVNISGTFTGVTLPVSLLTIGVSAIAGIPGVTMLLALQMII